MTVANDITRSVDLLRGGIIVGLCVDEIARLEVVDSHLDGERLVNPEVLAIHGYHKLGCGHICIGGDDTHRGGIAGAGLDLLTVRDGLIGNGETEIDKVVARREGGNLASGGNCLTVLLETSGNDFRIESQRRLGVVVAIIILVVVVVTVVVVVVVVVTVVATLVSGGGGSGSGGVICSTLVISVVISGAVVLIAGRNCEGLASQQRNEKDERRQNS